MPANNHSGKAIGKEIVFEYHGKLHFDWAVCVIEPKSYDKQDEPAEKQMQRMLLCVQIAHTFQGASEAFQRLFFHETLQQAEVFIKGRAGDVAKVLTAGELNRLRTFALAVISLTRFSAVTESVEDQSYFKTFELWHYSLPGLLC
jgi:hypothetical protein